jgi:Icc-related predicted phosphoesterase
MDVSTSGPSCLRIAAAGDIHCSEHHPEEVQRAFAGLPESADLLLLAGDLTTHGEPQQAQVLADACSSLDIPVVAVLGNHDWHADRTEQLVEILAPAGVKILDRSWTVCECAGVDVGVVGVKGFVGGFSGSHLPDFGEPLLRSVYGETSLEVQALEAGLREIELCPVRVALMHYAPIEDTVVGEPSGIRAFLGSDRLSAPIAQHEPDMVLHGHAHAGTFEGAIGSVPVYNVSVPVMGRAFWLFELDVSAPARTAIR